MMPMKNNNPFTDLSKLAAKSYLKEKAKGTETSNTNHFSQEAQDSFDKNERGSEDIIDMYEHGAFD